jgi:hypothetical protein
MNGETQPETRWCFQARRSQLVASEIACLRVLARRRRRASLQMLLNRTSGATTERAARSDPTHFNQSINQENT